MFSSDRPEFSAEQICSLLASSRTDVDFNEQPSYLAGRFVLLRMDKGGKMYVYHDTSATRSVYYSIACRLVSSHISLLASLVGASRLPYAEKDVRYALDFTGFRDLYALLPNHRIEISSMFVERYFPVKLNQFLSWSIEDKLNEAERLWSNSVNALCSRNEQIAVSVTGGADSRVTLAFLRGYWDRVHSFTYGLNAEAASKYSKVMSKDFALARQLVDICGLSHHSFIDLSDLPPLGEDLRGLLQLNTVAAHGQRLVGAYRRTYPGDGWTHIRSTAIEVMRGYWGKTASEARVRNIVNPANLPGVDERFPRFGYLSDMHGYTNSDLMYWELRMGKWHGEIMNENDAAFDTVLPQSVRRLFEIFLSFDYVDRKSSRFLYELVSRRAPWLHFVGINDMKNLWTRYQELLQTKGQNHGESLGPTSTISLPDEWLNSSVVSSDTESSPLLRLSGDGYLKVPQERFEKGFYVEATFYQAASSVSVFLELDSPYFYKPASMYFVHDLLLDGAVICRLPGGASVRSVSVALGGIPAGARLSLRTTALHSAKAESWERASRIRLTKFSVSASSQESFTCVVSSDQVSIGSAVSRA